jgi:hypothetical protein
VASLARPGRNVTGLSSLYRELVGKQLQLTRVGHATTREPLGECAPGVTSIITCHLCAV